MSGLSGGGSGGGSPGPPGPDSTFVERLYEVGVALNDFVYQKADGKVDRASAAGDTTSPPLGVVQAIDYPSAGICQVKHIGDYAGFSGLITGDVYILSKAPGQILWEGDTLNPNYPSNPGDIVCQVGVAKSASSLHVVIQDIIEL